MLTKQQIIEVINNLKLDVELDPHQVSVDESLRSLGIDSLDMFNILVELEQVSGRQVLDADVDQLTNIRKIEEYFA